MPAIAADPKGARTALLISFALVFLCGAVAGGFAAHSFSHVHPVGDRGKFASQFELGRLQKELDLTPEQTRQLETILDDVAKYYDNVLSDGQTRVLQILDERQKQKFQQLLESRNP